MALRIKGRVRRKIQVSERTVETRDVFSLTGKERKAKGQASVKDKKRKKLQYFTRFGLESGFTSQAQGAFEAKMLFI